MIGHHFSFILGPTGVGDGTSFGSDAKEPLLRPNNLTARQGKLKGPTANFAGQIEANEASLFFQLSQCRRLKSFTLVDRTTRRCPVCFTNQGPRGMRKFEKQNATELVDDQ